MGINSFADADLRATPAAVLQADLVAIQTAIAVRLAGASPDAADSYSINGKSEQRATLEFLMMYRNAIYRALGIQNAEPSGLGIYTGRFEGSDGGRLNCVPRNS